MRRRRRRATTQLASRTIINQATTLNANDVLNFFEIVPGGRLIVAGNNVRISDGIGVVSSAGHMISTTGSITDLTIENVRASYVAGGANNRVINATNIGGVISFTDSIINAISSTGSPILFDMNSAATLNVERTTITGGGFHNLSINSTANVSTVTNISNVVLERAAVHGTQIQIGNGNAVVNISDTIASRNAARGIQLLANVSAQTYRASLTRITAEDNVNSGVFFGILSTLNADRNFSLQMRSSVLQRNNTAGLPSEGDFVVNSTSTQVHDVALDVIGNTLGAVRITGASTNLSGLLIEGASSLENINTVSASVYPSPDIRKEVPIGFFSVTDLDVRRFISRATVSLLSFTTRSLSALVVLAAALKSASVWSSLISLYPLVGLSEFARNTALKSERQMSLVGTFTDGEESGRQPVGTSYAQTTENLNTLAAVTYLAHVLQYVPSAGVLIGGSTNFLAYGQEPTIVSVNGSWGASTAVANTATVASNTTVSYSANQASNSKLWVDGVLVEQIDNYSPPVVSPNATLRFWQNNAGLRQALHRVSAFALFNTELTDTQQLAVHNAILAFNTAINRT